MAQALNSLILLLLWLFSSSSASWRHWSSTCRSSATSLRATHCSRRHLCTRPPQGVAKCPLSIAALPHFLAPMREKLREIEVVTRAVEVIRVTRAVSLALSLALASHRLAPLVHPAKAPPSRRGLLEASGASWQDASPDGDSLAAPPPVSVSLPSVVENANELLLCGM